MAERVSLAYGQNFYTNLNLQTGGYTVRDGYHPATAQDKSGRVVDSLPLQLSGTSSADLRDKISAIERVFSYARDHDRPNDCAALFYAPLDENTPLWESRITGGVVVHPSNIQRRWKALKADITLEIERLPYWLGPTTMLPLSVSGGAPSIAAQQVYNHCNATHANYVLIDRTAVAGDLPAPLKLQMGNRQLLADGYSTILVGHNVESEPLHLLPALEGETSVDFISSPVIDDANCSSGKYINLTVNDASAEVDLTAFDLSPELLDYCKGRYFRVFAKFFNGRFDALRYRLTLTSYNTEIWRGPLMTGSTRSPLDLGVVQLPPWPDRLTTPDYLRLHIKVIETGAVATPFDVGLDFIYLMPLDGYRRYELNGQISADEHLTDDGINGAVYRGNFVSLGKRSDILTYGSPILLQPGVDQTLNFLFLTRTAAVAPATRLLEIQASYRPRKASL
jgi:hypothetical protein